MAREGRFYPSPIKRVVFTISELSSMAGISRGRMVRMLARSGVEVQRTGNRRIVMLSSLEAQFPQLVDSVRFRTDPEE